MKKAQIKITETISILFIFFILLLLGMLIFARYQKSVIKDKEEELKMEKALDIALKVRFIDELSCTHAGVITRDCIDGIKLSILNDTLSQNIDYYFNIFGFSTISIEEYGVSGGKEEFTIYSRVPKEYSSTLPVRFITTVLDPVRKEKHFSTLKVELYS